MDGKVGVFVNSVEGYQGCIVRDVKEAAAREGLEIEVFDAGHNAPKQAQDMVRFANQNPDRRLCIFVIPEADAIRDGDVESDPIFHLAARVLQKGVGLIVLNHGREDLVTVLRAKYPKLPVTLVAIDNVEFGRIQGRQLRALVPNGGTVLCVRGNPYDTACRDRTNGMQEELRAAGGIAGRRDRRPLGCRSRGAARLQVDHVAAAAPDGAARRRLAERPHGAGRQASAPAGGRRFGAPRAGACSHPRRRRPSGLWIALGQGGRAHGDGLRDAPGRVGRGAARALLARWHGAAHIDEKPCALASRAERSSDGLRLKHHRRSGPLPGCFGGSQRF